MEKTKKSAPQILKALVIAEAKNIRKNADKKELAKLSIDKLNPNSPLYCIYGQMTGDCYSERANDLIISCATRVFDTCDAKDDLIKESKLNGKPVIYRGGSPFSRPKYFSPIERFIYMKTNQKNGNNKALIAFLKGETKTLKLK